MAELRFEDIYARIVEFYPIGIKETDPNYQRHEGLMRLQDLCHEKVQRPQYGKWKSFVSSVTFKGFKIFKSSSESNLFDPCFTGRFLLASEKQGTATLTRELLIHLSVLGPFYVIYGLDKISLPIDGETMTFDPIIQVSPNGFYRQPFLDLKILIQENYNGVKFVPFNIGATRVDSLYVSGRKRESREFASVFQAIFVPEALHLYKFKGDIFHE